MIELLLELKMYRMRGVGADKSSQKYMILNSFNASEAPLSIYPIDLFNNSNDITRRTAN